jgi:transcriptional regulator with GAF, ATPase, and Fis domain
VNRSDRDQRLGAAFVALADTLVDDYDVIDLLDQLVAHSVALLGADAAGIVLGDAQRQLRTVAASSEDARTMELLQLQADEGPCLECYRTGTQVRVADLTEAARRWPVFAAAVERAGAFASIHAIPLRLRGQAIGALNLFHGAPGALPESDLALGQALADVATIGILQERAIRRGEVLNEQLQTALDSRVVIEQAKGVLAQHAALGMDAAFDALRRHARTHGVRLAELARQVVEGRVDLGVVSSARSGTAS